jgi:hypothetical protein
MDFFFGGFVESGQCARYRENFWLAKLCDVSERRAVGIVPTLPNPTDDDFAFKHHDEQYF